MEAASSQPATDAVQRASRARYADCAALALFVALSLAMLYPYPIHLATHLRDLGDPLEYAWVLGYSAHRLLTSPLHLYDGNIFYPFEGSLAYSDSTLASTLLALPVLLATANPVLATNLLLLTSFVVSGFGTYLLAADVTGSHRAGLVAGIIFAFNPYRMDHLSQIPNFAVEWMPLVLLSLHRVLSGRRRRWAAAFGLFLCLQFLSSFYYAYAISAAVAAYLLGILIARPRLLLRRDVALPLVAAGGVALAVLVAVAVPYFDVSQRYGLRRTLSETAGFAASLTSYLAVPEFNRTWGQVGRMVAWGRGERLLFPGAMALGLALVGLVRGRPRREAALFGLVGACGFVLSLGPSLVLAEDGPPIRLPFPLPYRLLFEYLPGFQSMRVPARFAIVAMLAIAVLAGLGTAYLLRLIAARRSANAAPGRAPGSGTEAPGAPPAVAASRSTQPHRLRQHALVGTLALVLLAEYASAPIPLQPIATGSDIPAVYRWLQGQTDKQVLVEIPIDDDAFHQAPYAYFSTYHRWTLVNGWRSFAPPGYGELATTLQGFPSKGSLAALAALRVRYVIVHAAQLPDGDWPLRFYRLQHSGDAVRLVQQFGSDYVYELGDAEASAAPAAAQLLVSAPCLAEAGRPYVASLVVDGRGELLVSLPGIPTSLAVDATWRAENGDTARELAVRNLPRPDVRSVRSVAVPLTAPAAPGPYGLTLDVRAPFTPGVTAMGPRKVVVRERGAPPPDANPAASLQAASFDLSVAAVRPRDVIPIRINWKARGHLRRTGRVFVNVYDRGFRVWSADARPLLPDLPADGVLCDGDEVLDVWELRLFRETPAGYYWVEFGVADPATGERQQILDPDGNSVTKVTAGRIRVSSGTPHASADVAAGHMSLANLGDQIQLLGWSGAPEQTAPGGSLRLTLYLEAIRPPEADYSVFVHLYDAAGRLVAQHDGSPGDGAWPTSLWQPGDVIDERLDLAIPAGLPAAEYTLAAGIYDVTTMRRLPLVEGPGLGDDRVLLGRLRIGAAGPTPGPTGG